MLHHTISQLYEEENAVWYRVEPTHILKSGAGAPAFEGNKKGSSQNHESISVLKQTNKKIPWDDP